MITTNIIDKIVVDFLFANSPINSLFLEISTRGITGKGISKLSITWLYTRIFKGSKPNSKATVVGITFTNLVIILLSQMLTFIPSNPSIMDWPAKVPIIEEEIPEERSVIKKIIPAKEPNKGIRVLYASDIEAIGVSCE